MSKRKVKPLGRRWKITRSQHIAMHRKKMGSMSVYDIVGWLRSEGVNIKRVNTVYEYLSRPVGDMNNYKPEPA